ncbi:hypothetical protein K438DRAFT_1749262 [Mycena galopus ATCC 62051]|nr:hypothetical protein K438DRAFT_1749262 [Mycena galopus ATCC 62051]
MLRRAKAARLARRAAHPYPTLVSTDAGDVYTFVPGHLRPIQSIQVNGSLVPIPTSELSATPGPTLRDCWPPPKKTSKTTSSNAFALALAREAAEDKRLLAQLKKIPEARADRKRRERTVQKQHMVMFAYVRVGDDAKDWRNRENCQECGGRQWFAVSGRSATPMWAATRAVHGGSGAQPNPARHRISASSGLQVKRGKTTGSGGSSRRLRAAKSRSGEVEIVSEEGVAPHPAPHSVSQSPLPQRVAVSQSPWPKAVTVSRDGGSAEVEA